MSLHYVLIIDIVKAVLASRFKKEIAFFQSRQDAVLNILVKTPSETLFLVKLLKKATEINLHFEKSGDEKYIIQINRVLDALNTVKTYGY